MHWQQLAPAKVAMAAVATLLVILYPDYVMGGRLVAGVVARNHM